jgi:HSP20 family protein
MLTRWNPFAELASVEQTMDRIFSDTFRSGAGQAPTEPSFFRLPVNVETVDGAYKITAPMPGFEPEEVEIAFQDGALTISGKHAQEQTGEKGRYLYREVRSGNLYRRIALSGEIDPAAITASFENGVLEVTVPLPEKAQPVKIPVGAGASAKALSSGTRSS